VLCHVWLGLERLLWPSMAGAIQWVMDLGLWFLYVAAAQAGLGFLTVTGLREVTTCCLPSPLGEVEAAGSSKD
jgi:hypothetical protein